MISIVVGLKTKNMPVLHCHLVLSCWFIGSSSAISCIDISVNWRFEFLVQFTWITMNHYLNLQTFSAYDWPWWLFPEHTLKNYQTSHNFCHHRYFVLSVDCFLIIWSLIMLSKIGLNSFLNSTLASGGVCYTQFCKSALVISGFIRHVFQKTLVTLHFDNWNCSYRCLQMPFSKLIDIFFTEVVSTIIISYTMYGVRSPLVLNKNLSDSFLWRIPLQRNLLHLDANTSHNAKSIPENIYRQYLQQINQCWIRILRELVQHQLIGSSIDSFQGPISPIWLKSAKHVLIFKNWLQLFCLL